MKKLCLVSWGTLVMLTLLIGCVAYIPEPGPYEVYAPGPPPAPIVVVAPAVPYPGAVWIGGFWTYHGNNWAWRHGYWERGPHAGAVWVPGGWHDAGRHGYGWKSGHWR